MRNRFVLSLDITDVLRGASLAIATRSEHMSGAATFWQSGLVYLTIMTPVLLWVGRFFGSLIVLGKVDVAGVIGRVGALLGTTVASIEEHLRARLTASQHAWAVTSGDSACDAVSLEVSIVIPNEKWTTLLLSLG